MKKAVDLSSAINSFDPTLFLRLLNAPELNPGNASCTYLELEREYALHFESLKEQP
jgi:glycerol-3-phosphate O-acyltransferase